jgi:amidase
VKDLLAVKDVRSTQGSPLMADFVPEEDDAPVARLKAAGAIVIGKTNVPEEGLGSHSFNPVYGATRNPYNPDLSAGGSSGGAAVALAAHMVYVADGSDMMGSVRNPAAWNNVYGFRPTAGAVPKDQDDAVLIHRLSTLGPMARNIEDLNALLVTLGASAISATTPIQGAAKIGWLGNWGGTFPMEQGILELAEKALGVFSELGWDVEPLDPPFSAESLWESWTTLRSFTVALSLGNDYADTMRRVQMKPEALWEVDRGFEINGEAVYRASAIRLAWLTTLENLFGRYDALVLPSTQVWPFPVEWRWPKAIGSVKMDTYHRWMEVVVPVSLAGLPCLNLPAGFGQAGLPGGIQLFGPRWSDSRILSLGQSYHAATDWPSQRPPAL